MATPRLGSLVDPSTKDRPDLLNDDDSFAERYNLEVEQFFDDEEKRDSRRFSFTPPSLSPSSSSSSSSSWGRICRVLMSVVMVLLISIGGLLIVLSKMNVLDLPFASLSSDGQNEPFVEAKSMSTVEGKRHGVVASDHPVCSRIGLQMLKDGGNAVDAAVATAFCLGVANPASSGIGGGAFILMQVNENNTRSGEYDGHIPEFVDARDAEFQQPFGGKILEVIDCRETAPLQSSRDMFADLPPSASTVGGLAIAIPGELMGLELAHARYGRLKWSAVVGPSVELAQDGVSVSSHLQDAIHSDSTAERWNFQGLRKLLTRDHDGETKLKAGDIIRNEQLANTLKAIMNYGSLVVYSGGRTSLLVKDIQQAGGIVTQEDLRNYRPTIRNPLIGDDTKGFKVVGVGPPSSGGATIIGATRLLTGYRNLRSTKKNHRLVEAMKHAFAIRMSLSDPAFNPEVNARAVEDLTKGKYMDVLREMTSDWHTLALSEYGGPRWAQLNDTQGQGIAVDAGEGDRSLRKIEDRNLLGFGYLNDHGTSHFSVMDGEGQAVSMTSSVNTNFGSGVLSESTGILLNSQMDDFSSPGRPNFFGLEPSEANYIKPGKKPLSSMSPTFVFEKKWDGSNDLVLAIGGSGGPKIITAVLQSLMNYLFDGMMLFDAVNHPRLHDQLLYHDQAVTTFENTQIGKIKLVASSKVRNELESTGHRLIPIGYSGCVQAVGRFVPSRVMTGVADIRKGGSPAGY